MEFLSSKGYQNKRFSEFFKIWNSSQEYSCKVHELKYTKREKDRKKKEEEKEIRRDIYPFGFLEPNSVN